MRAQLPFLGLSLALLAGAPAAGAAQGAGRPGRDAPSAPEEPQVGRSDPDVLVILGDDFNWDDLASVAAPNLARLASRGMTFRNAYVFPQCSTTRYSLLFGRYPRRDGIGTLVGMETPDPDHPVPPLGLLSLPEVLRSTPRSWFHSALVGKWHLGTHSEYDGDPDPDLGSLDLGAWTPQLHGFDRYLAGTMSNLPGEDGSGDYLHWSRVDDGSYSDAHEYAPEAQLAAFLAWWRRGGHRVAVVAPNLPHSPLHVPPPPWLPPGYPAPLDDRAKFEAMLVAFDLFVGRALAEVDLERTFVVVLSDNGTQPSVSITPCSPLTSGPCTKNTVWQGGINVPLFVAGPGVPAGAVTDALVSSTDVLATLAELLGVVSPAEDSISFAPVLFDPAARTRRIAFSETFEYVGFWNPTLRRQSAAIGERYKLRRVDDREQLFDLLADPRETVALPLDEPALAAVVAQLRAVLADPLDRSLQGY